jgi:hypothetical protein
MKAIDAMIREKYPRATVDEIAHAIKIVRSDLKQEIDEDEDEAAAFERVMEVVGELEPDQTVGEKLRIMAAAGDERARQILASWNTREARVRNALLDAAAERHPDWERAGNGWKYIGKGEPPRNMSVIVDWFQTTYPRDARRIEAETP